jgi:hypothetical protein
LQSCVVCDVLCCAVISVLDSWICSVAHDQREQHAAAWLASNNKNSSCSMLLLDQQLTCTKRTENLQFSCSSKRIATSSQLC